MARFLIWVEDHPHVFDALVALLTAAAIGFIVGWHFPG